MNFLNPLFLWALSALIVPLAIHLWSQRKVKTIKVGSIRYISEQQPRRTHSLHPNEWWLLILRMLSLGLLVLILAEPKLDLKPSRDPLTYVIEPSLLSNANIRTMIDSLPQAAVRLLRSGFPEISGYEVVRDTVPPAYWQLAQQLEKLQSDSIIVFTEALVSGIKGMRPSIKGNIHWVVIDAGTRIQSTVGAVKTADSVRLLKAESSSGYLAYFNEWVGVNSQNLRISETGDSIQFPQTSGQRTLPLTETKPTEILLGYHDSFLSEKDYLTASIRAVSRFLQQEISLQILKDTEIEKVDPAHFLIWLSPQLPPQTNQGLLTFRRDSLADRLLMPGTAARHFVLTDFLNAENVTAQHLPEQMIRILGLHSEVESQPKQYDLRAMDIKEFRPLAMAGMGSARKENTPLTGWLWLLLGILLITERVLAYMRRQ